MLEHNHIIIAILRCFFARDVVVRLCTLSDIRDAVVFVCGAYCTCYTQRIDVKCVNIVLNYG